MSRTNAAYDVSAAMAWLEKHSTKKTRDGMARFGLPSQHALGVTVADIRKLAKLIGRDHRLALDLWTTGCYEARMLTSFIDDPQQVTPAQMDRWARDFDNWGITDSLSFHLFDKTPHAWKKISAWRTRPEEFVKRAAFATLWGLTVHDKHAKNEPFVEGLGFIESAADDERHFVKKGVNMALRAIGKRNRALHAEALRCARALAQSGNAATRWIGSDAVRELSSAAVVKRLS
jgi:3-methyladenine DNA glycosylase AlkD